MPDLVLPKPTPPTSAATPVALPTSPVAPSPAPLKISPQGEIVDSSSDDLSLPPSTMQTAPPAPLPSPTTLPLAGSHSTTNPALVTPPASTAHTNQPADPTAPVSSIPISPPGAPTTPPTSSTSPASSTPTPVVTPATTKPAEVPSKLPTGSTPTPVPTPVTPPQPVTPPPTTLTALSSMTSASVPPTPPPSPATPPATGPKTQPVLAVAPKKSLPLTLLIGIGALVVLILGALAYFFFLRPQSTSTTTKPATNSTVDQSGTSAGGSAGQTTTGPGGTNANNQSGAGGTGAGASGVGANTGVETGAGGAVVLEYWGLWEPEELMVDVLNQYQTSHPGVSVRYTKQSYQDYRERLQTAIASGNGPDLFRFHASWVPMLKNELAPMPATIMSTAEFGNTFFPVATTQLQQGGQIVGMPLMYDGLVLYYNKDIFKTAGVDPPQTWADVRTLASKLTIRNSTGGLQRGGIAMGNVANVEHFADILGVLLLQNGADLTRPNSPQTRDALLFYTNFVKADKVWDDQLPSSTVAFARSDVAMMFAPSWRAHDIAAQNPSLQFGTVPLPKLSENRLAWATYWAEGVSQQSKHKQEAWELLKYLSSSDTLKKAYAKASNVRSFGEIYSRKDIAGELASTEVVKSVLEDAPFAQSWYLNSYTHDNGINDKLIQYYSDAVNGILAGKKPDEVLVTLEQGTAQVLGQYNIGLSL